MTATDQMKIELYEQYYGRVLRCIRAKVTDSDLAEDLASTVFLKVYEKLDSFDPEMASLTTWIYTIMRNTVTDYFRTRRVFEEIPETLSDDSSVEEEVIGDRMLEILADALRALEVRQRDIIILHYESGMTLLEISERMRIPYSTVKVLHHKALAELKKFF